MAKTKIEYVDRTWNPITGCSPISEGCANCWAKRFSKRLAGRYGYDKENPFQITHHWEHRDDPLHWKKPQRIFICSMGDLFHEDIPHYTEWFGTGTIGKMTIASIIYIAMKCPQHTFFFLTKRATPMRWFFSWFSSVGEKVPENFWLGVSVENQKRADERISILLQIPAAKHFVSVEPMLGPVDLWPYLYSKETLDWVIAGPETGPKARPCNKKWVADLYKQCRAAGVPFWDKTDILGKNIKERPNG